MADYITFSDLILFGNFVVNLIALVFMAKKK